MNNDWKKKQFDKMFQDSDYVDRRDGHWCVDGFVFDEKLDDFIQSLLDKQIEEIEGMRKHIPAIRDLDNPKKIISHKNTGYNQAISDIIEYLKQ